MSSDRLRLYSLLPFAYMAITRLATKRDAGYFAASSVLPGLWTLMRLGEHEPGAAVLHFAAGFLGFAALYEIGYLVNDSWDAPRNAHGRRRTGFAHGAGYLAAFVSVRLAVWAAIGVAFGWIETPVWLAGYAALVVVVAAHNLVQRPAFRAATYLQLACLRFALPVLGGIPSGSVILLLFIGAVFYAYLRLLGYLHGKQLLVMEDRRRADFGLVQMLLLAPLIAFAAYVSGERVLIELLGYYTAAYGSYALFVRR